jgi:hypothetical protein
MRQKIVLATMRLLAITLFAVCPAFSQSPNTVIEWMKDPFGKDGGKIEAQFKPLEIIEIETVSVDNKSITLGEPFTGDVDWIKRIGFRVRNVSPQAVKSIQIHVYLPEFKGPYIDYCYGCAKSEKVILPGEEVTLKVLLFYDWARDVVARQGGDISMISKASIRDIQVYRPDGSVFICVKTANQKSVCGSASP